MSKNEKDNIRITVKTLFVFQNTNDNLINILIMN